MEMVLFMNGNSKILPKKIVQICLYISGALGSTLLWISIICLCIHICIHTALKKLRNPPAQNLLALTCALCPAQLITALAITFNQSPSICKIVATSLHYFYLVSAFWVTVLHFDHCRVCFKRSLLHKVSMKANFLIIILKLENLAQKTIILLVITYKT